LTDAPFVPAPPKKMNRKPPPSDSPEPAGVNASWSLPTVEVPLEAMQISGETFTPASTARHMIDVEPAATVGFATETASPCAPQFDVAGPFSGEKPAPVIASALLDESAQDGLRYLFNYASKSIRKNRAIAEHDRDDLLHEIYLEWWVCVGFESAALPRLLAADSFERKSLRESIYRVFGRHRYHKTAHRTQELSETDGSVTSDLDENRDFTIDLDKWLERLPDAEAKVIDLYYFQHKTMEEIGAELGLAKQRVSEIHKRALARHPDVSGW